MSVSKQLVQKARDLRLKKGLSQNFLVDEAVLARIAAASDDPDKTLPIVEIGPGSGFLTERLLQTGHPVAAIEVDSKMIRVLTELYGGNPDFSLVHEDVRKVDLASLLTPRGIIVGNIPYHLTGPILFQIIGELADADYPLRQLVTYTILMVQKEVGQRLVAKPGDKAYSQLSIQAQFWFDTTPVVLVPRSSFYPSPEVDSLVVQLVPRHAPAVPVKSLKFFSRLVKACFMHRRKTLLNNLKIGQFAPNEALPGIMDRLELPPSCRPEDLSICQFGALADVLTPPD